MHVFKCTTCEWYSRIARVGKKSELINLTIICDHLDLQVVEEDGGRDDDAYVSRK